ncbi:uncharacterized protein [Pocillopora verrucosa]|uniref:uncharacterized protein n=1 Tax=Pocillopora verrucosa TaxID=203993 RepID=UPI00333F6CD7
MAAACKLDYLPSSRRELTLTREDVQENVSYESRKRVKSSESSNQGEQPENYGKRKKRDAAVATVDYHDEESDFNKEDNGISLEELHKTNGWKMLMENLDKHFERKNLDSQ